MNPNDQNNLMEELKEEQENNTSNVIQEAISKYRNNSRSDNELKDKLMKYLLIIAIVAVVIIVILFVFSNIANGKKTYSDVEDIMINASKKYYTDNSSSLPKSNGGTVEVSVQNLVNNKYMKSLDKYIKNTSCTGKVVVENNDDNYIYIPYLDCGSTYKTTELYRKVTDKENIVTSGNGLYSYSDGYVFRGDNVNNYVSINDALWRIVKVTTDNEVVLTKQDKGISISQPWDDRYNTDKGYNVGINDFNVSRLKDTLNSLYDDKEANLFSDDIKGHITSHNLCIGKRGYNDNQGNECSVQSESMKLGLLTVSDYIRASLDGSCVSAASESCQNYNYLVNEEYDWWLLTASNENTYQAYYVNNYGKVDISNTSSGKKIRPVIYLNSKTMFTSGTGSSTDPYKIK